MRFCKNNRAAGFTLVELLISLAITGLILAAVGTAFNASMMNYRENESLYKSVVMARKVLFQIAGQIRNASAVDPEAVENECSLITDSGEDITYRFDSGRGELFVVEGDDLSGSESMICDGLEGVSFEKFLGQNGGQTYVESVRVSLTMLAGEASKKVSCSAVVRKNLP